MKKLSEKLSEAINRIGSKQQAVYVECSFMEYGNTRLANTPTVQADWLADTINESLAVSGTACAYLYNFYEHGYTAVHLCDIVAALGDIAKAIEVAEQVSLTTVEELGAEKAGKHLYSIFNGPTGNFEKFLTHVEGKRAEITGPLEINVLSKDATTYDETVSIFVSPGADLCRADGTNYGAVSALSGDHTLTITYGVVMSGGRKVGMTQNPIASFHVGDM